MKAVDQWTVMYREAVLEADRLKKPAAISKARIAIADRLREGQGISDAEHKLIADALEALIVRETEARTWKQGHR